MTAKQLEQIAALRQENYPLQLYWPGTGAFPQYREVYL